MKNTTYFVRAAGFLFFVFLTILSDYFFRFGFKRHHYAIIFVVAFLGVLLSPLYFIYPNYDKILHLIIPILLGIVIFFLVDKLDAPLSVKLTLTFTIVVTIVSMHEVGEYILDQIFDWKLQGVYIRDYSEIAKLKIIQGKNDDTMTDMILSTLGALIFVLAKTYIYWYKRLVSKKS